MVGILVSFWDGLFSGAMLVSGRVYHATSSHMELLFFFPEASLVRFDMETQLKTTWMHFSQTIPTMDVCGIFPYMDH